jgi:hypothetical protein
MNRFYKIICFLLIVASLARVAAQSDGRSEDPSRAEYQDSVERARQNMEALQSDDISPEEYQEIVERARRDEEESRKRSARARAERQARLDAIHEHYEAERQAEYEYYQALREKHSDLELPALSNRDYDFLDGIRPSLEAGEDPESEIERVKEAAHYANNLSVSLEDALTNLEKYRAEWSEITSSYTSGPPDKIVIATVIFLLISCSVIGYSLLRMRLKKKRLNAPEISLPVRKKNTGTADELLKYHTLLKEGAITQGEYEKIKGEILRQASAALK